MQDSVQNWDVGAQGSWLISESAAARRISDKAFLSYISSADFGKGIAKMENPQDAETPQRHRVHQQRDNYHRCPLHDETTSRVLPFRTPVI